MFAVRLMFYSFYHRDFSRTFGRSVFSYLHAREFHEIEFPALFLSPNKIYLVYSGMQISRYLCSISEEFYRLFVRFETRDKTERAETILFAGRSSSFSATIERGYRLFRSTFAIFKSDISFFLKYTVARRFFRKDSRVFSLSSSSVFFFSLNDYSREAFNPWLFSSGVPRCVSIPSVIIPNRYIDQPPKMCKFNSRGIEFETRFD